MSGHSARAGNFREVLRRKHVPSAGVIRLSLVLMCLLSLALSASITHDKFTYSGETNFSIVEGSTDEHYGVFGDYVVLWPDEITYINWIFTRFDSFEKMVNGERGLSTNFYGYLVSGTYIISGYDWKILFGIGVLNFLLFFHSCVMLLNYFCKDRPIFKIALMAVIVLSPTVINLSSGFLRDLLLLGIVNYSFLSILNRKIFSFLFCVAIIFFLRNFMLVVLCPMFIYFYFLHNKTIWGFDKNFAMVILTIIFSLSLFLGLEKMGAQNKPPFEIVIRFFELMTGVNTVLLNFHKVSFAKGAALMEILAHGYQFFIAMLVYLYIIVRGGRIDRFFVPFIATCLLLSILYGSFLGFFVARTKLIVLWLLILFVAVCSQDKLFSARRRLGTTYG